MGFGAERSGAVNPTSPSALFAGTAEPDQGRCFCAAGEQRHMEVWSGADRRSRRQRSGRSVHRRDAMRNSSDRFGVGHCGAAKQRGTIPLYSCRRRSLGREGLSALWVIGAGGEVIGNSLNELIR